MQMGKIMKKLNNVAAVCILLVVLFSPAITQAVPICKQVVWAWDEHSDRLFSADQTQSAFNSGFIPAKPHLPEKSGSIDAAEKTVSLTAFEKCLSQDCRGLSSSGNRPADANFNITANTAVDGMLHYAVGDDCAKSTVRSDLF